MTFQKKMRKIFKRRAKGSLLGYFSAPGPTRKLRAEVTSSPGRAELAWVSKVTSKGSKQLA